MKITTLAMSDLPKDCRLARVLREEYFYLPENIEYESLYHQYKYVDLSFVFLMDGLPVLAFPLTEFEDEFSFYGKPLKYFLNPDLNDENKFIITNHFILTFDKLILEKNIKRFSFLSDQCFNKHFLSKIVSNKYQLNSIIDLSVSDSLITRGLRKSYRSLINWGKRELATMLVDHNNLNAELFEEVRLFHIGVAGRETRSVETWNKQFEMIRNNHAFLVVSQLEGKLCSAALVLHGENEAYYGVAINDRQMMGDNRPLGHHTIFYSIMHAKKLGLKLFNLGPIVYEDMNDKEKQIALFKGGFTSTLSSSLHFNVEI